MEPWAVAKNALSCDSQTISFYLEFIGFIMRNVKVVNVNSVITY